MSRADAMIQVGRMIAAYGQESITSERVAIYAENLSDIPADTLAAAVNVLLASSKFFPAIAEVRQSAAKVAGVLPPTAAEILALIRRADRRETVYRRDGSVAYVERYWDWPEDASPRAVELAQDLLAKVGEPCDESGDDYFGWANGCTKTYDAIADDLGRKALADLSRAYLPAAQRPMLATREVA